VIAYEREWASEGAIGGRVPIGVERRNGAFFRKVIHYTRAGLPDGRRRNAP